MEYTEQEEAERSHPKIHPTGASVGPAKCPCVGQRTVALAVVRNRSIKILSQNMLLCRTAPWHSFFSRLFTGRPSFSMSQASFHCSQVCLSAPCFVRTGMNDFEPVGPQLTCLTSKLILKRISTFQKCSLCFTQVITSEIFK